MKKVEFETIFKCAAGAGCGVLAGWVLWRGACFQDASAGYSMVPSVMCSLTGLMLVLTGLAIAFRSARSQGE